MNPLVRLLLLIEASPIGRVLDLIADHTINPIINRLFPPDDFNKHQQ